MSVHYNRLEDDLICEYKTLFPHKLERYRIFDIFNISTPSIEIPDVLHRCSRSLYRVCGQRSLTQHLGVVANPDNFSPHVEVQRGSYVGEGVKIDDSCIFSNVILDGNIIITDSIISNHVCIVNHSPEPLYIDNACISRDVYIQACGSIKDTNIENVVCIINTSDKIDMSTPIYGPINFDGCIKEYKDLELNYNDIHISIRIFNHKDMLFMSMNNEKVKYSFRISNLIENLTSENVIENICMFESVPNITKALVDVCPELAHPKYSLQNMHETLANELKGYTYVCPWNIRLCDLQLIINEKRIYDLKSPQLLSENDLHVVKNSNNEYVICTSIGHIVGEYKNNVFKLLLG